MTAPVARRVAEKAVPKDAVRAMKAVTAARAAAKVASDNRGNRTGRPDRNSAGKDRTEVQSCF